MRSANRHYQGARKRALSRGAVGTGPEDEPISHSQSALRTISSSSRKYGRSTRLVHFAAFAGPLGVKFLLCGPRHPEAKGLVERANSSWRRRSCPGGCHLAGRLQHPAGDRAELRQHAGTPAEALVPPLSQVAVAFVGSFALDLGRVDGGLKLEPGWVCGAGRSRRGQIVRFP